MLNLLLNYSLRCSKAEIYQGLVLTRIFADKLIAINISFSGNISFLFLANLFRYSVDIIQNDAIQKLNGGPLTDYLQLTLSFTKYL